MDNPFSTTINKLLEGEKNNAKYVSSLYRGMFKMYGNLQFML
ncbi:hypothetical protein bcere0018_56620 [Bacillus cereus Rock1-15]|nr:hypothetical protein bcere0018_56620 [Bacillus cereus Rock1-15]